MRGCQTLMWLAACCYQQTEERDNFKGYQVTLSQHLYTHVVYLLIFRASNQCFTIFASFLYTNINVISYFALLMTQTIAAIK